MGWYAIRTVYHFGIKTDGTNVFEERVVCFRAESSDEAHEKASAESEEYAARNGVEAHPEQSGYQQDGEALIDGYELWSELFESRDTLESFYSERYGKYEYHPEPPDA